MRMKTYANIQFYCHKFSAFAVFKAPTVDTNELDSSELNRKWHISELNRRWPISLFALKSYLRIIEIACPGECLRFRKYNVLFYSINFFYKQE